MYVICIDLLQYFLYVQILFLTIYISFIIIASSYLYDYQFLVAKKISSARFESLCRCGCYGEAALIARLATS